jgi:hypothetical protein
MIRNYSLAAMAALAVWLTAPTETCVAGTLSVDAPPNVSLGDTFTVNVDVTGITDLYGFQFDLGFDPTILMADSSTEGPFLPSGGATFFIPGAIDNAGGTVAATADTLETAISGVTGDGTLASFSFEALADGPSALTLSNALMVDSGDNLIDFDLSDGSVVVGEASAAPEPSSFLLLAVAALAIGFRKWGML